MNNLDRERVLARLRPYAFEVCIAANAVVAGFLGLLGLSTLWRLVPGVVAAVLDGSYVAAGGMILLGLTVRRGDVEVAGLVLLSSAAVIRLAARGYLLVEHGVTFDMLLATSFYFFLVAACAGRVHSLVCDETIVVVRER